MVSKIIAAAVIGAAALSQAAPVAQYGGYSQSSDASYTEPTPSLKSAYPYTVSSYGSKPSYGSSYNSKPTYSTSAYYSKPTYSTSAYYSKPTYSSSANTWEDWKSTTTTSSTWADWTPTTSSTWDDWESTTTTSSTWADWTPTTSSSWEDWQSTTTSSSTWADWTPATSSSWNDWSSPSSGPIATIVPEHTSQYHVGNGAVDFDVATVEVFKSTSDNGNDLSALVTFEVPAAYASYQCQLVFDLIDGQVSGTQKAQLFTSLAPATADAATWPSGNLRDQFEGTIDVVAGARATYEAGSGPLATTNGVFPCSAIAGKIFGGEVVPQGDNDYIYWNTQSGIDGPKIIVL